MTQARDRFVHRRTSMSRFDESLLLRCSTLQFGVAPADRAPVPVIGHWHTAFDADTYTLCGFRGLRRKQALEKRHSTSPVRCPSNPYAPARGRVTRLPKSSPYAWTASAETRFALIDRCPIYRRFSATIGSTLIARRAGAAAATAATTDSVIATHANVGPSVGVT